MQMFQMWLCFPFAFMSCSGSPPPSHCGFFILLQRSSSAVFCSLSPSLVWEKKREPLSETLESCYQTVQIIPNQKDYGSDSYKGSFISSAELIKHVQVFIVPYLQCFVVILATLLYGRPDVKVCHIETRSERSWLVEGHLQSSWQKEHLNRS